MAEPLVLRHSSESPSRFRPRRHRIRAQWMKMPNLAVASQVGRGRTRSAQVSPRSVPELVLAGVRNPNGWCDAQYRQDRTAGGLRERDRQAVGPALERQRLLVTD